MEVSIPAPTQLPTLDDPPNVPQPMEPALEEAPPYGRPATNTLNLHERVLLSLFPISLIYVFV